MCKPMKRTSHGSSIPAVIVIKIDNKSVNNDNSLIIDNSLMANLSIWDEYEAVKKSRRSSNSCSRWNSSGYKDHCPSKPTQHQQQQQHLHHYHQITTIPTPAR